MTPRWTRTVMRACSGAYFEQRRLPIRGILDSPVDALQRGGYGPAVFSGDEAQALAQQMDDTGLHGGVGKNRSDGIGKSLQAIDDGDENVFDAAVLELVHRPRRALAFCFVALLIRNLFPLFGKRYLFVSSRFRTVNRIPLHLETL